MEVVHISKKRHLSLDEIALVSASEPASPQPSSLSRKESRKQDALKKIELRHHAELAAQIFDRISAWVDALRRQNYTPISLTPEELQDPVTAAAIRILSANSGPLRQARTAVAVALLHSGRREHSLSIEGKPAYRVRIRLNPRD